jgi:hypothetical protein
VYALDRFSNEKELVLGGKKIAQSGTSKLFGQVAEQTLSKRKNEPVET